jgi:DNA-binding NtrC family response regulator
MAHLNGNGNGQAHQEPDESFPLVLVVDDRERDLDYTVGLLARNGFRAVAASTYTEAVRELDRQRFLALIADYWLEEKTAETGEDVIRRAKTLQPHCALVMFSADPLAELAAERTGAKFFDKENTASGLVALLREAVRRAAMI